MHEYQIYKMYFKAGVHFGNGLLNSSEMTCRADTLFSALFLEAIKQGQEEKLLKAVKEDHLRISDAFPFQGDTCFLPKPRLHIPAEDSGNSIDKKFFKKLLYVPAEDMKAFLSGKMKRENRVKDLCIISSRTAAAIRGNEETLPYQVGVCHFAEGAGLYVIVRTDDREAELLADELFLALSSAGIGGKRAEGLGRFELENRKPAAAVLEGLKRSSGVKMLLSAALPQEEELENALDGASYRLIQRSGYVLSETYAPEQRRKKTLYMMEAGSCFNNEFKGDVYDVSRGGAHPVFRYGKPLFFAL